MTHASDSSIPTFSTARRVIAVIDLAGYFRAARGRPDAAVAAFLDDFYRLCLEHLEPAGGRVVKFIGDACLAVFDPAACAAAVQAVVAVTEGLPAMGRRHGLDLEAGANVHLGELVEATFSAPAPHRHDVVGSQVNHAFTMGRGAGVRLSEPVYRQLPSDARGPWQKHKAPATYVLTS